MMKFDDTLGLLGGFGRYQILVLVVWNVFYSGNSWQYFLTVFIADKMDHWCYVPELQHLNQTMQKTISIPKTIGPLGDTVYKKCSMFDYNYSAINFTDPNNVDAWIDINNGTTPEIRCNNGWVYDKSVRESTVVSQFELVCERDWMFTLPATFQMLGLLLGAFFSGLLSDKFGRKRTALVMLISSIGAIIGGSLSDNFLLLLFMRLLSLLTSLGAYTCLWVLTLEMMPPVHRTHATFYGSLVRILGAFLTLTAYFVRGHKWLQIISAFVTIPGLIGILFLSESPRWLISKGRYIEAEDICRRIARINRVTIPDDFTLGEDDDITEKGGLLENLEPKKKVSVIDLIRTPNMRKRTLVIWVQWFAVVFGAYAMVLNVGTLIPGDIYLNNFVVNGLCDLILPVFLYSALFKMGRKTIIISFFIVNGILSLAMVGLIPTKIMALTTTTAMCGSILINIVLRVLYLYSGEIFPTPARNVGIGSGSSVGRIGGLISPNIPLLGKVWYGLPYVILGVFPLIAGTIAYVLPETKDRRLPETFPEAELFGTGITDEESDSDGNKGSVKDLVEAVRDKDHDKDSIML